jgi:hypothetical protein
MLEFSDKVIGTVTVQKQITESDIENIVVTAFEGGCNYWMGLIRTKEWEDKPKNEPLGTWATKLLIEGKTIKLYDIEDDEEGWELTLEKVLKGIELNVVNRPFDCDLEDFDAYTADCIIQYALFGEIVYG